MEKKVFIFLSMKPHEGGKYQYSLAMLNSVDKLGKSGFKFYAIYYDKEWESLIPDSLSKIIINKRGFIVSVIRKIILSLPVFGLKLWRRLSSKMDPVFKFLSREKTDLIIFPGGDSLSYESTIPSLVTVFDLMHRYESRFPEVSGKKIYRQREKHYKRLSKFSNAILVDSAVGKSQMIESYHTKPDKIFIIPFTAPDYIHNISPIDVVKKYNLPERFIFYPAQFWTHKNHENLLKAIGILKQKEIKINAVFVGSEKNRKERIIDIVNKSGLQNQVYILNYVSNQDLVSLYRYAVALVMPTFFGPTNIPQLEAFALQCPVITSNIYGIPDQVGDAALLVDPKDANDIAKKIEILWNDQELRFKLVSEGNKMNAKYSLTNFASLFKDSLNSIL